MLQWLIEEFARNLKTELAPLLENPEELDCLAVRGPAPPDDETPLQWWSLPFDVAPDAALTIGISQALCREIHARWRRGGSLDGASAEQVVTHIEETVLTVSSHIARKISELAKIKVHRGNGIPVEPPSGQGTAVTIHLAFGDESRQYLRGFLNQPFLEYLDRLPADLLARGGDDPANHISNVALRALMDVQMPVAISLGRSRLPFQEVLKLSSGSVVQLDRQLTDPVDVVVNGHVIARGEIVVVEGSYGVRIQSVCGNGTAG